MKILFYDIYSFEKKYFLDKIPYGVEPYFFNYSLNEKTEIIKKYSDSEAVCTFLNSTLDENILSKFKNLKYIFLRSTGYSHLNLEYCKENNIQIYNVPLYGSRTVAEYAFALILNLSRKITQAKISIQNADISKDELIGFDLFKKTIGIIGAGNIGKEITKIAAGFNLNILINDTKQDVKDIEYTDLKTLLTKSDIVVVSCPLNDSTKKMINLNNIFYMKQNAILINVARGEIVDTEALYIALKDKRISGAGIDTIECEETLCELYKKCSTKDNLKENCIKKFLFVKKLSKMENVIITPHNAYNTIEARKRILDMTLANINSVLKNNNFGTKVLF